MEIGHRFDTQFLIIQSRDEGVLYVEVRKVFPECRAPVKRVRAASRITPKLMPLTDARASVYGCWGPEDEIPELDDKPVVDLAAARRYLIFDSIPDPDQTSGKNPEQFLRKAERLAQIGPGIALFGSERWREIQAITNRVDVHFPLSKVSDRITLEIQRAGKNLHLNLPQRDAFPFNLSMSFD